MAACDHFSKTANADWCAFIDIDEFLYSPYAIADFLKGKDVKIMQKKFEDRFDYPTALEITRTFSIDTRFWAPKLIINMAHYVKGGPSIHELNFNSSRGPLLQDLGVLRFNHYNHNSRGHDWLLENCNWLDPTWRGEVRGCIH